MRQKITVACVCLGLGALAPVTIAAPGGNGDGNGPESSARACAKLKNADKAAFRALYGPKKAMRNCKRGDAPEATSVKVKELKSAARECRAEREADPDAFKETYGTNNNKRNAFGKCVAGNVKKGSGEE